MTIPPQPPAMDPGNPFVAKVPANLTTSELMTPDGRLGVATFRTPGTTLSVLLTRDEVANWAEALQKLANQMSGLVVATPGAMPLLVPGTGAGQ
jgi:hypothetical protein